MDRPNRTSYPLRDIPAVNYRHLDTQGSKVYQTETPLTEQEVEPARNMDTSELGEGVPESVNVSDVAGQNASSPWLNIATILQQLKSDLKSDMRDLKSDMSGLDAKLDANRSDLKSDMSGLQADLESKISSLNAKLDANRDDLKSEMNAIDARLEQQERAITERVDNLAEQWQDRFDGKIRVMKEALNDEIQIRMSEVRDDLTAHVANSQIIVEERQVKFEDRMSQQIEALEETVQQKLLGVVSENDDDVSGNSVLTRRIASLETRVATLALEPPEPHASGSVKEGHVHGRPDASKDPEVNRNNGEGNVHVPTTSTALTGAMFHHPAKVWSEQVPKFEGKSYENPVTFLSKLEEYIALFGLTDGDTMRVLNMAFSYNAYYWWQVVRPSIQNYSDFRAKFLSHFWNSKVQGNVRAQLHAERYIPGQSKGLEFHLADTYERSRNLDPPVSDDEYMAMVVNQLPFRYQTLCTGWRSHDLVAFREDLVNIDRIERLQRQQGRKEGEQQFQPRNQTTQPPPQFQPRDGRANNRNFNEKRVNQLERISAPYPEERNRLNRGWKDQDRPYHHPKPYHRRRRYNHYRNRRAYSDEEEERRGEHRYTRDDRTGRSSHNNSRSVSPRDDRRRTDGNVNGSPSHPPNNDRSRNDQSPNVQQLNFRPAEINWHNAPTFVPSAPMIDGRNGMFSRGVPTAEMLWPPPGNGSQQPKEN